MRRARNTSLGHQAGVKGRNPKSLQYTGTKQRSTQLCPYGYSYCTRSPSRLIGQTELFPASCYLAFLSPDCRYPLSSSHGFPLQGAPCIRAKYRECDTHMCYFMPPSSPPFRPMFFRVLGDACRKPSSCVFSLTSNRRAEDCQHKGNQSVTSSANHTEAHLCHLVPPALRGANGLAQQSLEIRKLSSLQDRSDAIFRYTSHDCPNYW